MDLLVHGSEKIDRLEFTVTMVIFVAVVMPVVEEIVFRGPIRCLVYFKSSKYLVLAVLVATSILFGFLHVYNYNNPYSITAIAYAVTKAVGGAMFGLAVIKYNSLAVSITAHCLLNGSLTTIILLAKA